ncbi:MAG: cysteine hydrolase family protein [Peptococcaceae bacterium]
MSQKVLVVIDMQNDFISGSLGTSEAQAIVKKVKTKINQAVKNKDAVLFTRDTHGADYLDTQEGKKLPVPHCIRYTSGWQIEKSLQIPDARIFDKNTFGSLDLVHHLLCANCTEVEIVGVCTDICVVSNALLMKAYLPELTIRVDSSCCAGTTPENHQKALDVMAQCQIEVL